MKRIVADQSSDKAMSQNVLSKKLRGLPLKRQLVDKVRVDWEVSTRRACEALQMNRTLYVYKSKVASSPISHIG